MTRQRAAPGPHSSCSPLRGLGVRGRVWLLGGSLLLGLLLAPPAHARQHTVGDEAIGRAATAAAATPVEREAIRRVYARRGHAAAWTTADGALSTAARSVAAVLQQADTHGLDPAAYLTRSLETARVAADRDRPSRAERDVAFTLAVLRYMKHLHLGRVDPREVGLRLDTWAEPHDFPDVLAAALDRGDVVGALDRLAPPWPLYAQLREARRRYRTLTDASWATPLRLVAPVRPGAPLPAAPALRARLAALGDLPGGAVDAAATTLDPALVAALVRFQRRHGLTPDGVLGRRTIAALDVPPSARLRQIDVALERLRWVPDLGQRPVVAVNIPMFGLWAWSTDPRTSAPALAMDVIVGRAMRTETPVLVDAIERVIFRPYWNVPVSIVRDEVLPALARDPGYLDRQRMELVRGPGDDAVVVPVTPDAIARLAAGSLRLRQRPGPHNALGLVKFVFPNRESVYMHGTPAPALFAQARRDFSHGCIRVEDPAALAAWVLKDLPDWPPERIGAAMQATAPQQVDLPSPIDVVLFYLTAAVLPEDGALHFADDIYGHDARLAAALARK